MTDGEPSGVGTKSPASLDWRGRLTSALLGTTAGGLIINILSNDYRWRAVAVALAAGVIMAATYWLRRLPARSMLVRYSSRILLVLALAVTVFAAIGSAEAASWATAAAAGLTVGAVLVQADHAMAMKLLRGAAAIGGGMAFIGAGVAVLIDIDSLAGIALIGLGVAVIGVGVAALIDSDTVAEVALIGAGAALGGAGVAVLLDFDTLTGIALIGLGVAVIGAAAAALIDIDSLGGIALIGAGVALIGVGVAALIDRDVLLGIALICLGVATIGVGVAVLIGSDTLTGIALVGVGVALIGIGVAALIDIGTLLGIAAVGFGVAVIGVGVALIDEGARRRLRAWWNRVTADPANAAAAIKAASEAPSTMDVNRRPDPRPERPSGQK